MAVLLEAIELELGLLRGGRRAERLRIPDEDALARSAAAEGRLPDAGLLAPSHANSPTGDDGIVSEAGEAQPALTRVNHGSRDLTPHDAN